jgi:hypothetical protein
MQQSLSPSLCTPSPGGLGGRGEGMKKLGGALGRVRTSPIFYISYNPILEDNPLYYCNRPILFRVRDNKNHPIPAYRTY